MSPREISYTLSAIRYGLWRLYYVQVAFAIVASESLKVFAGGAHE